jgi:hypothetical protein
LRNADGRNDHEEYQRFGRSQTISIELKRFLINIQGNRLARVERTSVSQCQIQIKYFESPAGKIEMPDR